MSELESERSSLSAFLKSKIRVPITVEGKGLVIGSREETLLSRNVKIYVKRFLYHRGFSETYRVIEEHEVIRITKRKRRGERRIEKKGTPPSPYDTMPYYFPIHP